MKIYDIRKKPYQAVRLNKRNRLEVIAWINEYDLGHDAHEVDGKGIMFFCRNNGMMLCNYDDYIIKTGMHDFFICQGGLFSMKWEIL